jgi:hypothetical protein
MRFRFFGMAGLSGEKRTARRTSDYRYAMIRAAKDA